MKQQLLAIDPSTYTRHALHGEDRTWAETNCYVDLWIELLHAHNLDPVASLPFTVAMDFEGDQWTFFKQPSSDLYALYGIDVQELAIWKPLADHATEQVSRGRAVLAEVDSYFLPDTAGVSYKLDHTKTTIAIQSIDINAKTLGYFHNAGYFQLSGDDFDGVFRLGQYTAAPELLAAYTEIAKFTRPEAATTSALVTTAKDLLSFHLARRPSVNPVAQYRSQFARDVEWLSQSDMTVFHQYAFATLRQCGACAELAATFVRWLEAGGERELGAAAAGFDTMASTAKSLQFKIARTVATKKQFDPAPMFSAMEEGWDSALGLLVARYGG